MAKKESGGARKEPSKASLFLLVFVLVLDGCCALDNLEFENESEDENEDDVGKALRR